MLDRKSGEDVDAFACHQFVGHPHRIARIGTVVARNHFELLAEHAALGVDLLDRHFPALLVGIEERGLGLVAVEFADLDGVLGKSRPAQKDRQCAGACEET
jgi:hypothetical protein